MLSVQAGIHHKGARLLNFQLSTIAVHRRAVGLRIERYGDKFCKDFAQLLRNEPLSCRLIGWQAADALQK